MGSHIVKPRRLDAICGIEVVMSIYSRNDITWSRAHYRYISLNVVEILRVTDIAAQITAIAIGPKIDEETEALKRLGQAKKGAT